MCVLNRPLYAFGQEQCTLGADFPTNIGPVGYTVSYTPVGPMTGGGGNLADIIASKRDSVPLWTYVKGRGHWAQVKIDGTVIVQRKDENERFYEVSEISSPQILAGEVQRPGGSLLQLYEMLLAVDGQRLPVSKMSPAEKSPGEYMIDAAPEYS